MIPTPTQLDSLPFLLVRPSMTMKSDVMDDDGETTEIPASKSVPPHAPPVPVVTTEHELPSVIVDSLELQASDLATRELQRESDVDVLLTSVETFEVTIPLEATLPLLEPSSFEALDPCEVTGPITRPAPAQRGRSRGFAIAALAALMAAGGTFAGLKVCHVSGGSISAALHTVR